MSTPTKDDVGKALIAHAKRFSKAAAMRVLMCSGGVDKLSKLPKERFQYVIDVANVEPPPPFVPADSVSIMGIVMGLGGISRRVFEYTLRGESYSVMIGGEMEVNPGLRMVYWDTRRMAESFFEQAEEKGIPANEMGLFERKDGGLVGTADLMEGDGPHEVAWIACMLVEAHGVGIGFPIPDKVKMRPMYGIHIQPER